MLAVVRSIGALVAGFIAALVLVIAVEGMSAILHPFPEGVDPHDLEACKAHVANYPTGVLALCALCWAGAVLVASFIATRLGTARHSAHGGAIGALLLALAIMNMAMLPYPGWFWAANLILFPLGCWLGVRLGGMPPADPDLPAKFASEVQAS